ncbi:sulfatase family protein [Colwellia psychrerythraea]|uniref:Sulfatase family protein n=1 Tax=Colwellia psychrerythraea (strain 34H / ATCC BAA-681) TaxID=167879 RepID=Q482D3_COLP3|nr:sulfatase [Colwellia psychrerythraea]AAZ27815.1 sulfatase family protein [Colwellia psychrerythraea 34H]
MKQFNSIKVALCLALALSSVTSFAKEQRPNILLIVAEDMSAKVGAFGDTVAKTPVLDELAKSSVRYPNTFTTAGVCAPSRTSLITGVHQITVGGQHMRTRSFKASNYRAVPAPDVKAFPELLRKSGYYTYVSSKLDYQFSNTSPHTGPFTIWNYEGKKPTWRGREKDQPFFGMYHLDITHESQLFPKKSTKNKKSGLVKNWITPERVVIPAYYPDTQLIREGIALHYNNIHAMDTQVGKLLAELKKDGLSDNTIVIWTTDHGDSLPRGKREVYDSGLKVPMIIHWPDKYRPSKTVNGSIDSQLLSFVDIAPSILAMANINTPAYIQGKARIPNNNATNKIAKREYIYASKDRLDEFPFRERAVRNNKFKYIKNYLPNKPGATHLAYRDQMILMQDLWREFEAGRMNKQQAFWFNNRPGEELYDIINDPEEVNNLAEKVEYQQQLNIMRNALKEWQSHVDDLSDRPEIELANEFWPNGQQPITAKPSIYLDESGLIAIKGNTQGSSIGYQTSNLNKKGKWITSKIRVYNQPFAVEKGMKIIAKAVRYGYKTSEKTIRIF